MLWRQGYETRIVRDYNLVVTDAVSLEDQPYRREDFGVVLLGRGAQSLIQLEVWKRLILGDFGPDFKFAQVLTGTNPAMLKGIIPASEAATVFATGAEYNDIAICGAWVRQARILMIGLPTESAWDEFCEAVKV